MTRFDVIVAGLGAGAPEGMLLLRLAQLRLGDELTRRVYGAE